MKVLNKLQLFLAWFLIPRGFYCEGCPFWFIDKSRDEQMNGYCSYLGKGDWDFYKEMPARVKVLRRQSNGSYKEELIDKESGICNTMLWDGIKACKKR